VRHHKLGWPAGFLIGEVAVYFADVAKTLEDGGPNQGRVTVPPQHFSAIAFDQPDGCRPIL